MSSESNETMYKYKNDNKLYKIVKGSLAGSLEGVQLVSIKSITPPFEVTENVPTTDLLIFEEEENPNLTGSPLKVKIKRVATPPSKVKTTSSSAKSEEVTDSTTIDRLNNDFNNNLENTEQYGEKYEENPEKFANPNLCFTEFTVVNNILKDILRANKLCYSFRKDTPDMINLKFGISGELSLAGLLQFAFITFHCIVNSYQFVELFPKLKPDNVKKLKKNLTQTVKNFNKNYNAVKITRSETTSQDILNLSTQMLTALDYMYSMSLDLDETYDADKLFLEDCFNVIKKILLTKTTLDVSQCHTLKYLDVLPRHVLMTTSDFSAACNIEYAPVLTSKTFYISNTQALYTNSSETQFIMDNVAVYGYLWFIYRYKKTGSDSSSIVYSFPIKTENKLIEILGLSTKDNLYTLFTRLYSTIRSFYEDNPLKDDITNKVNFDIVSSDNLYSKGFIKLLETKIDIDEKRITTFYKLLELIGKQLDVTDFVLDKDLYMIYSKLFLNYCISKEYLSYKKLTLNSRAIRDHDFANSPIRCFGIAEKMNIDIKKCMSEFSTRHSINPTEEEIIEYLLSKETNDITTKYKNYKESEKVTNPNSRGTTKTKRDTNMEQEKNKYISVYGEEYIPIHKYIGNSDNEILLLYYIICNQTYEEFEKFQYQQLNNNRAFVYVTSVNKELYISNTSLFDLSDFQKNLDTVTTFSNNNNITIDQRWEMERNKCAGTTDLFIKRGGSNLAINGVFIVGTVTEADAASCPIGFFTRKIHCPDQATLYLNGYECAKIYTGRSKEQSESKEDKFETTLYVFSALYNAKTYSFTNVNYMDYLGALKTSLEKEREIIGYLTYVSNNSNNMSCSSSIREIIEKIEEVTRDIIHTIDNIDSIIKKQQKKVTSKEVYIVISEIIRKYLTNVNTFYDRIGSDNMDEKSENCSLPIKNDVANILSRFANVFYSILCSNDYKNYKIIEGSQTAVNKEYNVMDEEEVPVEEGVTRVSKEAKKYDKDDNGQYGGGTYSNEDLDYAVYIFPNNLGKYEAFYNYLSVKAAQEEQEEIERAKKEKAVKLLNDDDAEVENITDSNQGELGSPTPNAISPRTLFKTPSNTLLHNAGEDFTPISAPISTPILANAGGKKTKTHKKPKKPKNKKTTKKYVKRQTKHNKTTKRKKTTKRPAKRTRRQRHHPKIKLQ